MAGQAQVAWRVVRTPHFLIYYTAGNEAAARDSGEFAEAWRIIIADKLKYDFPGTTPIYLYPDRQSFATEMGVSPDNAMVGAAHTRTLSISVDASGLFTDIRHVIPHELVHVFVFHELKENAIDMPLWMHEGLAKYLTNDWNGADAELLNEAATNGEIMPLQRISSIFPRDPHGTSVAYTESYGVVRFMAEKYTPACIPDLLTELADGKPFPTAMQYSIGITPEEFEAQWQQYVWEKYRLNRWLEAAGALVFFVMSIAVIFAYRRRRIQLRKKVEQFEREDPGDDGLEY